MCAPPFLYLNDQVVPVRFSAVSMAHPARDPVLALLVLALVRLSNQRSISKFSIYDQGKIEALALFPPEHFVIIM